MTQHLCQKEIPVAAARQQYLLEAMLTHSWGMSKTNWLDHFGYILGRF
jgi:hypothetical protein